MLGLMASVIRTATRTETKTEYEKEARIRHLERRAREARQAELETVTSVKAV